MPTFDLQPDEVTFTHSMSVIFRNHKVHTVDGNQKSGEKTTSWWEFNYQLHQVQDEFPMVAKATTVPARFPPMPPPAKAGFESSD